jgi:hypothetical protein
MRPFPAKWALPTRQTTGDVGKPKDPARAGEDGSAVVEFIFLAVLLMMPLAYLVLTLGQLQGGAYAVVGAADQAAKVYVSQQDPAAAQQAAEQSVVMAVQDLGFSADNVKLVISCDGGCLTPGSTVSARVSLTVPLPVVSAVPGVNLTAATLNASASQVVGRFR